MEIIWFLLLLIVVIFVLGFWLTARAKRQFETVTALSPARIRAIVEDSFGKLFWAPTDGPGDINMRRRTPNDSGITVSISFESAQDGKTHVQAWMSAWKTRYGMIANSAGSGVPKKIIAKIDQAA